MRAIIHFIAILGLIIFNQGQLFAKSIIISVDSIFNNILDITEIKVIEYIGDSIMKYIEIESQDTLKIDCKLKKYNASTIKIIKENDSLYNSLEGTFPEVGETLLMLTYNYGGNRILFARKENDNYIFWDPNSIPFVNSVFFVANNGIYKPTELCKGSSFTETEFYCSEGFLIEEKELKIIIASR